VQNSSEYYTNKIKETCDEYQIDHFHVHVL